MTPFQDELAKWLEGHGYDTFATLTFGKAWPDGPSGNAVLSHSQRWMEESKVRRCFLVVERGTSGMRRAHAHGLLKTPLPRQSLWRGWSKRYGRCTFDEVSQIGGCAGYVAKYVTKMPDRWAITSNGQWR